MRRTLGRAAELAAWRDPAATERARSRRRFMEVLLRV
jgi:ribonuclease D